MIKPIHRLRDTLCDNDLTALHHILQRLPDQWLLVTVKSGKNVISQIPSLWFFSYPYPNSGKLLGAEMADDIFHTVVPSGAPFGTDT